MEKFLQLSHNVKECFAKYTKEDILNMSTNQKLSLCINERTELAKYVLTTDNLSTKNVINERLKNIELRRSNEIQKRREFLDDAFKV